MHSYYVRISEMLFKYEPRHAHSQHYIQNHHRSSISTGLGFMYDDSKNHCIVKFVENEAI